MADITVTKTFGAKHSPKGATQYNGWYKDTKVVCKFTLPDKALISKLSINVGLYGGVEDTPIKGLIYSDSNGAPGTLVAVTEEVVKTTSAVELLDLPFTSHVELAPGTYWIGFFHDAPNYRVRAFYKPGSTNQTATATDDYTDGASETFGTPSYTDREFSFFATYTTTVTMNYPPAIEGNTVVSGLTKKMGIRWQEKSFAAQGRIWVFYIDRVDGVDKVFYTSSADDGESWATPIELASGLLEYTGENVQAIHELKSDVDYVHVFYRKTGLYYRRGQLNSDGSISWTADWNNFWNHGLTGMVYQVDFYAVLDSNGYPWVTWGYCNTNIKDMIPYITKSSRNDGIWETEDPVTTDNEDVYTDAFSETSVEWTETGASPYLDDSDSNYISTSTDAQLESYWTFPNTSASGTLNSVKLRFEATRSAIPENTFKIEVWDGSEWVDMGTVTLPSSYGWVEKDVSSAINSWAKVDSLQVRVTSDIGTPNPLYIRRLVRRVNYTHGTYPKALTDNYDDRALTNNFVVALSDGKVYAFYFGAKGTSTVANLTGKIYGKLWNGVAWGPEETCTTSKIVQQYATGYESWSRGVAVDSDDNIHLVFLDEDTSSSLPAFSWSIRYVKRTWGVGWGTEEVVEPDILYKSASPGMSLYGDEVRVFWTGSPSPNIIHMAILDSEGWWSGVIYLVDETTDTIPNTDDAGYDGMINPFPKMYEDKLGFIWITKTNGSTPYKIKFGFEEYKEYFRVYKKTYSKTETSDFERILKRFKQTKGVPSFDVTLKTLMLGDRDSVTGWYAKEYEDSTIEMFVVPKGSFQSFFGIGFHATLDALGFTKEAVNIYDRIVDAANRYWEIKDVVPIVIGDTLKCWKCDLKEIFIV